jgi:4-hydroxy-4-methyl-2-oxoglutarate aldolase
MNATWSARLSALDSGAVSDALDSLGLPPAVSGLAPLGSSRRIAGPIRTVKLAAGPAPGASRRHLGTAVIEAALPGDVIVIEHAGNECAGWGGVLSTAAQLQGVAGVVIDGAARDIDEARALDFPLYARAACARTARGRVHEVGFDCVVRIAGIEVRPGDFALADASGVVLIPAVRIAEVVRRAERITARERLMIEALRKGEPVTEVVGRDYETMLEHLE